METAVESADRSKWLHNVYNARNRQELEESYDAWAEEYDQDVLSYGYRSPSIVTGLIARYVKPEDGTILDAGAGTGIVAEILTPLGYKELVAIDLSQRMLDLARTKGLYLDAKRMVLGKHLDFPDNRFVASIAAGVFTAGHAPAESFDELIRITKAGGYIIFTIRAEVYLNDDFKDKQNALENEEKWQLVEITDPFQSLPREEPGAMLQGFVYRVS